MKVANYTPGFMHLLQKAGIHLSRVKAHSGKLHTNCTRLEIAAYSTGFSVQSIMGAMDRRRDGGTMAMAAGMVEGVLMLEGVVA
jgi:hypothetical protein